MLPTRHFALRLWTTAIISTEFVDALSVDKDQMTAFLYLLIVLFLFFIILILSVCIHICRLSWTGIKERRGGNVDADAGELTECPREFHVRIERATESRSCREQSL
ncbi:hypothetical protein PMAYCL1PPCAC_06213 [Pristionchus mayeri]|uniref:Uncharacterized protein n=1 Tax=Pristionchus mayeri TaxID=1317129 RepID=A0AAN5C3R8_9BILA|nr:hypothetical protein PMAYCL1PPCAC_06213 [Pristionchus mayeri]